MSAAAIERPVEDAQLEAFSPAPLVPLVLDLTSLDTSGVDVAASQEIPLYQCGTFAPGQVHDPCQHSVIWVKCCGCAGCPADVWQCGRELPGEVYLGSVILDEQTAQLVAWVSTPPGLIAMALIAIMTLVSGVIPAVLDTLMLIVLLGGFVLVAEISALAGWLL